MSETIYKGILTIHQEKVFLLTADGNRLFEDEIIWSGYLAHFTGMKVCARRLLQRDYETGKPLLIVWPDEPLPEEPFVELYFNERLAKYPASFLGHLAINVNGEIFNFSHKINENEALRHEEYFYRPALGEFAPHPASGRDNTENPQKPYYDKFGRRFMRTIHALRLTGLDTPELSIFFHNALSFIRNAPPDLKRPDDYARFNYFTRNCATIIRDGFRHSGFADIRGIFPRELFVNIAYAFSKHSPEPLIRVSRFTLSQLIVSEAAPSVMSPLLNPFNRCKYRCLESRRTTF
jgi:hypothetical protein